MPDVLALFQRAQAAFSARVDAIGPDQWAASTPCTGWNVRALVNHLVYEQVWVPPLLAGATAAEVGDRFEGDLLGADPAATWHATSAASAAALAAPGALDRTVTVSYGELAAAVYCREMVSDLTIHSWDLARAIGAPEALDPDLVEISLAHMEPMIDAWQDAGIFAPRIPAPDGADPQTRLLLLSGRQP
jgi:uncharacterized protein (TIGR03086 family)